MALKTQYQMKMKQREKRHKRRAKLAAKGLNQNDYFYGGYYLKPFGKEETT